jgi:hypothetical protein
MPGRGPVPKAQHQRERDTKRRQADSVTVSDDGVLRGPELVGAYSASTFDWYETWRTAPQAALFEATDWQRLQMMAPLVDTYFRAPSTAALAEIRLNEERLGATYVDRQRAKIRIQDRDAEGAAVLHIVTPAEDVAARLRGTKK